LLSLPVELNEYGEEVVLFKTNSAVKIKETHSIIGCRQDYFVFGTNTSNMSHSSASFRKDVDGVPVPSADLMRFLIYS
jgi:hypothetical protein